MTASLSDKYIIHDYTLYLIKGISEVYEDQPEYTVYNVVSVPDNIMGLISTKSYVKKYTYSEVKEQYPEYFI